MSKEYSPTLARVIGAGNVACVSSTPALSREDIAELQKILKGKRADDPAIDAKQAVTVLARVAPTKKSATILGGILASSRQPARLRVSAAAGLGIAATDAAEQALLGALETRDPVIRAEVIKSLGKVGGPDSLERLAGWPKSASDEERRLAAFAHSLVALRTGNADRNTVPGKRWRGQKLTAIDGELVAGRVGKLWGSTYGLALNRDVGFAMKCGKAELSFLLNGDLKQGAWLGPVRERPLLAGVVVAREPGLEQHAVRHLVMTSPTRKGFTVSVTRTSGDVVFAGEAIRTSEGYQLSMRDVGRERFATRLDGLITDAAIDLELKTWLGAPRLKSHGHAISTQP